jgi:putative chitinase
MKTEQELEEGWRSVAAGIATGIGLGAGGYHLDKLLQPGATQAVTQPAAAQVPQKIVDHARSLLATPNGQLLKSVAVKSGLQGQALAAFLAQCAHESQNFTRLKEFGGKLDYRKYDPKFNPQKARELGNKQVGDGARYAGRGFIQITGRWNYAQLEKALNLPLTKHPELLEKPHIAARASVWYWQNRVEPNVANYDDVAATTKPINRGLKGLEDRKIKYMGMKHVLVNEPAHVKTAK